MNANEPTTTTPTRGKAARLANTFWLGTAAVALALAAIHVRFQMLDREPAWQSRTVWAFAAVGIAALLVRFLFPAGLRLNLLALAATVVLLELALQAAAWMGALPLVNTKEAIPWGRVYWTAEGLGNSVRNRDAWHVPPFVLTATNRIALIGDSFVEAVEVHRTKNVGALLDKRLQARSPESAVLTLGVHGTGPAQYLEVLRYAHQHHAIREAVFMIYLGNDITDCSRTFGIHDPSSFIYYARATNGALLLDATGMAAQKRYTEDLERRHRPVWQFLPRLALNHSMLVQLPASVRNAAKLRQQMREHVARATGFEANIARLGLKAAPFEVTASPDGAEAMAVLTGLLDAAVKFGREHSIRLQVVTVPFFPPDFYAQTNRVRWTARLGQHDFLKPERELKEWAAARGVPLLALGDRWMTDGVALETIRSFYLSNGSGHFSEAGHHAASTAMEQVFFNPTATR